MAEISEEDREMLENNPPPMPMEDDEVPAQVCVLV